MERQAFEIESPSKFGVAPESVSMEPVRDRFRNVGIKISVRVSISISSSFLLPSMMLSMSWFWHLKIADTTSAANWNRCLGSLAKHFAVRPTNSSGIAKRARRGSGNVLSCLYAMSANDAPENGVVRLQSQ